MRRLIDAFSWSETALGSRESWPLYLRTALNRCLNAPEPGLIWWGPDWLMLYNDAYRPLLGKVKHPQALGQPRRDCWPEHWPLINPTLEAVVSNEETIQLEQQLFPLEQEGYLEEAYFSCSYKPLWDEAGQVRAVFTVLRETTRQVISERRLQTLYTLAIRASTAKTAWTACQLAAQALADNQADPRWLYF